MKLRIPVLAVLVGLIGTTSAHAGIVRLDLPELLGDYQMDESGAKTYARSTTLTTPWFVMGVEQVRLVLEGTVTAGVLRGDGINVPAEDLPLRGGFGSQFDVNNTGWPVWPVQDTVGPFHQETSSTGPFYTVIPLPGGVEGRFNPVVSVVLAVDPDACGAAPDGMSGLFGRQWSNYTCPTPLTGTLTAAYLLVEGPGIPEPTTLGALLLSGLALLRRRR